MENGRTDVVRWSEELSPFDFMMYRADLDPRSRTSMMYIETLDLVPRWDRLWEEIDRVSRVALRLRHKVVAPILPLTNPRWVVDADFDLAYHVRRLVLPEPADLRCLLDTAAVLYETPLDPSRPLWEVTLAEGLRDGDGVAALIWKLSHSTTDGIGGMILEQMLRTDERDPAAGPMPPLPVPEDLSPVELTRSAARRLPAALVTDAVHRFGTARRIVRDPGPAVGGVARAIRSLGALSQPVAPPSPLLRRRSLNRRFETFDVPLADLRGAAKAHGCSVNDAYLAAVTLGLGRYHTELGVPLDALPIGVPINVRPAGDTSSTANRWAGVTIAAPTGERDPVAAMTLLREQMIRARTNTGAGVIDLVASVLAWLPQPLLAGRGSPGVDVQVSNVPGHPGVRYIAGARILRTIPLGPIPGVAMMITMVSRAGRCFVGINFDSAAISDHDLLLRCLRAAFDDVIAAGSTKPRRPKRPSAAATSRQPGAPRRSGRTS